MNNTEKNIGKYVFKKFDGFWMSNFEFNGSESSFEVFKETLDEGMLHEILHELKGKILRIDKEGKLLLDILSEVFWGHKQNIFFKFSGFVIDNMTDSLMIDFRMCYHCAGNDGFSDFANWFIDVKDFRIVGCIRQQL